MKSVSGKELAKILERKAGFYYASREAITSTARAAVRFVCQCRFTETKHSRQVCYGI
jgi:hypothetical protein